jgi:hypothetical protein
MARHESGDSLAGDRHGNAGKQQGLLRRSKHELAVASDESHLIFFVKQVTVDKRHCGVLDCAHAGCFAVTGRARIFCQGAQGVRCQRNGNRDCWK